MPADHVSLCFFLSMGIQLTLPIEGFLELASPLLRQGHMDILALVVNTRVREKPSRPFHLFKPTLASHTRTLPELCSDRRPQIGQSAKACSFPVGSLVVKRYSQLQVDRIASAFRSVTGKGNSVARRYTFLGHARTLPRTTAMWRPLPQLTVS